MKQYRGMFAAGIALGLLAACGSTDDGGGTGGTGVSMRAGASVGVIATKDATSVQVNGVRFASGGAQVIVNDGVASMDSLKPGMVVKVRGRVSNADATGAADSIRYEAIVLGPAESVAESKLVVLGQTVSLSSETQCRDVAIDAIACTDFMLGDKLEVSGLIDLEGVIHATFIARKSPALTNRVHGTVSSLDTNTHTFAINALTVQYSLAALGDLAPANDATVDVEGTLTAGGVLLASAVSNDRGYFATETEGDDAELDGYVTAVFAPGRFDVNGQAIQASDSTRYRGVTAAEIAVGMRLEVEGMLGNGFLDARDIERKSR